MEQPLNLGPVLHSTAATLMLTAGVNPKTSVAITLDCYSHVMPTMQAEAVRRLDGVLAEN